MIRRFNIHKTIIRSDISAIFDAFDLKSYDGLDPVYIGYGNIVRLSSGHDSIIGVSTSGIFPVNSFKVNIDGIDTL